MDETSRRLWMLAGGAIAILLLAWRLGPGSIPPVERRAPDPSHVLEPADGAGEAVRRLDVQGHRGARGLRPENTLVGFEHALRLGVSTLELDLGITADRAVVVAHDPYVDPKLCQWSDGEVLEDERGPLLRDLRLEDLRALDCGSLNPDPDRFPEPPRENAPGEPIPTLDEVFDLVRQRSYDDVRFNIEIKSVPGSDDTIPLEEFVATVIDVVRKYDMVARTTIQSFDWQALVIADRIDPRLRLAALLEEDTLAPSWLAGLSLGPGESAVDLLARLDAEVDDFSPYAHDLLLPSDWLADGIAPFRERGVRVIPWTVNDTDSMERLIEMGVDGIITDRPDLLLELCRRRGIEIGW